MKPNLSSYVLLKDGTMLGCTSEQKNQLLMAVLLSEDVSNKRVKLGGKIFTLNDVESDPEKILKSSQQTMPLGDKPKDIPRNMG